MSKLYGVCPPVITIFSEEGKIDLEANKKQADFLIEKEVDGLAYLGTSGEFSTLTLVEKKDFIKEMFGYVNGRVKVIVGVGDTSLINTLEFLEYVENLGVDGVLLINPYFSVYSEEMVEAYYNKVASFTKLPIILYNFPDLTGFNFSSDLVIRLVQKNDNIAGIKETIGDPGHLRDMNRVKQYNPEFTIFCAYENQGLGALINGADGFINATANFAPEFSVKTYQSFKSNDLNQAAKWYEKMCSSMDVYDFSQPLFLACKQAVYARVLKKEGFERLPAISLSTTAKDGIKDKLIELDLL